MFKYMTVEVIGPVYFPNAKVLGSAEHIDSLGSAGWELVAVVKQGEANVAYFKMEVEDGLESASGGN
jgi:hypothetical protein